MHNCRNTVFLIHIVCGEPYVMVVKMKILSLLACILVPTLICQGKEATAAVTCDKGNIVYVSADGLRNRLTDSGRDKDPVLHPGGEWVYFIRSFEGHFEEEKYIPPAGKQVLPDTLLQEELWRVRRNGADAQMLYRHDIAGPGLNEVASIDNIQFSPNGALVYFEASRWATSDELWVIDKDGKRPHALGAGNGTRVVQSSTLGNYRGFIVTCQHRYFVFGGSYDWYYLFTPDMKKEIGPIGEKLSKITEDILVFVPTNRMD